MVLHFQRKTEKRSPRSLTAMTGLKCATEAYFLFQELQAALASIGILSHNTDELRCRLDWCSLVLGMWKRRKGNGGGSAVEEWILIMESWQSILEGTASMAIGFALPSRDTPPLAWDENKSIITLDKMLRYMWCYITKDTQILVDSVFTAARPREWTLPLRHDRPFRKMIAHLRSNIHKDNPIRVLRQQRLHGIEVSHLEGFVEDIEKEAGTLLGFLTSEEREDLEQVLLRLIDSTLTTTQAVDYDLPNLRICQRIMSQWLSGDHKLQLIVETSLRTLVQRVFHNIATRSSHDWKNQPTPPIDKDLSEVLALGADVNGGLYSRSSSTLHDIASLNCPINSFRALITAGALYRNNWDHDSSSLQAAAGANNTDAVAFLLDRRLHSFDININARDQLGQTALH